MRIEDRPTPLTDRHAFDSDGRNWTQPRVDGPFVNAEFARLLERQLAHAEEALHTLSLYVSVNGDDWVNREATKALADIAESRK